MQAITINYNNNLTSNLIYNSYKSIHRIQLLTLMDGDVKSPFTPSPNHASNDENNLLTSPWAKENRTSLKLNTK